MELGEAMEGAGQALPCEALGLGDRARHEGKLGTPQQPWVPSFNCHAFVVY
jgi:hypothetical protein